MRIPSELTRVKVALRPLITRRYFKTHPVPKLQLGCGDQIAAGWLNADKFDSRADIYLNTYGRFPFRDESFKYVYAEHLLEHLAIHKVRHFFSEVFRVLESEGVARLTVPDLELFARNYVGRNDEFFRPIVTRHRDWTSGGDEKSWIVRTNGAAFMSLANIRFFHHRWMYDFETIERCALAVGFAKALKQQFRVGISSDVASLDRAHRKSETLYVDLIKKD